MAKHSVLLLGATGATGSSILEALLSSGSFTVVAGVRPASASKPEVYTLKARDVEICTLVLENGTVDQLAESLKEASHVVKKAGVKRFVPDDWATACVRGVRTIYDSRLAIHDYIKEAGIVYTYLYRRRLVAMELTLPIEEPSKAPYPTYLELFKRKYGAGDVKSAVTDRRDIGKSVARIIADERTLKNTNVSVDELLQTVKQSKDIIEQTISQYAYSMWIRGDNTVENAKKPEYGGALDAKELYPDLAKELTSLEKYAKELYSA